MNTPLNILTLAQDAGPSLTPIWVILVYLGLLIGLVMLRRNGQ